MNTKSINSIINFEPFVEWDNSPFVLFSNEGKILYVNHSAEILFGSVGAKEMYELALAYAPAGFGYITTSISLNYDSFLFYAVTVGYENEEHISLRLYHTPHLKQTRSVHGESLILTDINVLLEANIALFKTKNPNPLTLLTDQEIPQCKIDQNNFSKLLRKVLYAFRASSSLDITLKLLIGQYLVVDYQKQSLIGLHFRANGRYVDGDKEIEAISSLCHVKPILKENAILLEIPLIQ